MKFKKLTRVLCVGALAAAIGGAAAMSGCTIETSHARAKVTIEFNGTSYELNYTLYRNMYPVTVRHFIELAESGFYDNTIIHNYTSNDWYGGGFSYNDTTVEDETESYSDAIANDSMYDYLSDNDLEEKYYNLFYNVTNGKAVYSGNLTASVYKIYDDYNSLGDMTVSNEDAYYTIYGEFSNNGHTVANGQRGADYGSIKMYYTSKVIDEENSAASHVFVKTDKGEVLERGYSYNSATSLFALQVGSSSSLSTSSYASFAYLKSDDDVDTLDDLLEAVEDYIDDYYSDDESKFTTSIDAYQTDNYESIADPGTEVTYTVTVTPIIIRSVKITKY